MDIKNLINKLPEGEKVYANFFDKEGVEHILVVERNGELYKCDLYDKHIGLTYEKLCKSLDNVNSNYPVRVYTTTLKEI